MITIITPFCTTPEAEDILKHATYAKMAFAWCLERGIACVGPMLCYTPITMSRPDLREKALAASTRLIERSDEVFAFVDLGITTSMRHDLAKAKMLGVPFRHVMIEGFAEKIEDEMDSFVTTKEVIENYNHNPESGTFKSLGGASA